MQLTLIKKWIKLLKNDKKEKIKNVKLQNYYK